EGGREAGLAMVEEVVKALVGLLRGAEAGELAHRPETPAVHRRVDAAGVGVLAGIAEVPLGVGSLAILLGVERPDLMPGDRLEERLALLELRIDLGQPLVRAATRLRLYRHSLSLRWLFRLFEAPAARPPAAAGSAVAPAIASFRPSCSNRITCQSSWRAIVSRSASGLTTTALPTARSIGRSLTESE